MTDKHHYTIGELAKAADTTPRTIRYYTAEGLLPPPDARGRYALYSADHLARLRLIARLKAAYLPLSEIQARLAPLAADEVQQLLAQPEDTAAPSDASDYIAQVLQTPRRSVPPQHPQADESSFAQRPAMLHEQRQSYAAAPPESDRPAMQLGYAAFRPTARDPAATPSMLRRVVPHGPPHAAAEEQQVAGECWQRVTLAPGVELHIRAPVAEEERNQIEQLLDAAQKLFE